MIHLLIVKIIRIMATINVLDKSSLKLKLTTHIHHIEIRLKIQLLHKTLLKKIVKWELLLAIIKMKFHIKITGMTLNMYQGLVVEANKIKILCKNSPRLKIR